MKKLFQAISLTVFLCGCGSHFGDEVTLQDIMRSNNANAPETAFSAPVADTNAEVQNNAFSVQVAEDISDQGEVPTSQLPPAVNFSDFSEANITPEVYGIAARRATLRMMDSSSTLYFGKNPRPSIYISDVVKLNEQMPDGFYFAKKATRDIIEGSRNFNVTDNPDEADYILKIAVNAVPTEYVGMPAIDYQLALTDKEGNEIQRWSASIKQVADGDGSWW